MPLPFGEGWKDRYGDQEISQFRGAQLICEKWGISRRQLEEFALESHQRAVRAIDEGRFEREIAPVDGVSADEGPRRDTSLEKMAGLAPLREGWEITAATASQISDGAAALLIASEDGGPAARAHAAGADRRADGHRRRPGVHADRRRSRPPSRRSARAGLKVDDIDVFEVNEAFAPVLIAWSRDTGASLEKTNPNGGAIALGHPARRDRCRADDQAAA